jgi:DNA-3-methyladenine glycosylase II
MLTTTAAHKVLKADRIMAHLIENAVRYEPDDRLKQTPFEVLARAIAHQQLHATAANNILARFVAMFEGGVFPLPQHVIDADAARLRAVGFSHAKIAALKDLASKCLSGIVPDRATLDALSDAQIIERLSEVRGIGRWTVEMMLMFHMQRPDVLPVDDFGVRNGFRLAYGLKGMPTPKALAEFGERWKPYRSMAAWYLWRANELAKQNLLPKPKNPPRLALQKPPKMKRKIVKRKKQSAKQPKKVVRARKSKRTRAASRRRA